LQQNKQRSTLPICANFEGRNTITGAGANMAKVSIAILPAATARS
jgi:hypothetical protein